MNDYELVTILNGEINDDDVDDTVERISQFITNRGGEVQNIDQWGRRRLAYPIARQFEGTYVVTHLRLPPANAAELEANLRISEEVLRHLLVRYSPAEQAAAIAAAQRRRPRPVSEEMPEEATGAEAAMPTGALAPATDESPSPEAEVVEAEAIAADAAPAPAVEEAAEAEAEPASLDEPHEPTTASAPEAPVEPIVEQAVGETESTGAVADEAAAGATATPRRTRTRKPREEA